MLPNSTINKLSRLVQDENGATAIEYGLIASLIAVAIITGATALGSNLSASFSYVSGLMKTS